jgi:hypothetical protein
MSTNPLKVTDTEDGESCRADQSCGTTTDSTCGCGPDIPERRTATAPRGAMAALLALACAAACLAVPLAAGGAAAVSGAVTGRWWLIGAVVAVGVVALTATVRRRGRAC